MIHSIGRFSNECFAGCNFGKLVNEIFDKSLKKPNEGRENKTPDTKMICIDCNRRVTFRGKGVECESCKNWFMQNAKISLTQSIRPCRILFGFVPIVQKKVQKRT